MSEVTWKDHGWKHVLDTASELGRYIVKAGVVGEKADEMHGDSDLSNAEVAIINELGTDDGHVPSRPFVKETFQRGRAEVAATLASAVRSAIFGVGGVGIGARRALENVGDWAAEQVRKTIRDGVPPPNAPATVIKKGSSRTLIDTEQLMRAVGRLVVIGRSVFGDYEEAEISGVTGEGFE